jgi:aminopeptidase 2
MCKAQGEAGAGSTPTTARDLLPTNVVPRHYHVTLETNFEEFTFDGTVVIDVDVAEESTSIKLNTLELELHKTSVSCDGADIRYVKQGYRHGYKSVRRCEDLTKLAMQCQL